MEAIGIKISGFITSDEFYSDKIKERYGLPIIYSSQLKNISKENCGIVLSMMRTNANQVIRNLEKMKINFYNPVLL
jgi:hypothetical protein